VQVPDLVEEALGGRHGGDVAEGAGPAHDGMLRRCTCDRSPKFPRVEAPSRPFWRCTAGEPVSATVPAPVI
jgi:hypothetical protein